MRPSKKAWLGLAAGVVAYDILCPQGETLSEGIDSALENHQLLTAATIGAVSLHLLNVFPEQIDPIHQMFRVIKGRREG